MANEYRKTSREELTAMADELRAVGPFQEGQQFVFPSSEYDESPAYIFKIVESGAWSEITRAEADELVEQGYDMQEIDEFPAVSEAAENTVYFTAQRQLGFAEAYQELIDDFYDKIIFGTLTQEDVDGIVYSKPLRLFGTTVLSNSQAFPLITELTISESLLKDDNESFRRLSNIKKINIIENSNVKEIKGGKFTNLKTLEELSYTPTSIGDSAFFVCENLKFGEGYLNLNNCKYYGVNCLRDCSITELTITEGAVISGYSFRDSLLEKVYLPDTPITLTNVNAFDGVSTNLKFYVTSQSVIDAYNNATNWSALISKFEVITL